MMLLLLIFIVSSAFGTVTLRYWSEGKCEDSIGEYSFTESCTENYDQTYVIANACNDIKYFTDSGCTKSYSDQSYSSDCKKFGSYWVTCSSWNDSATALFALGGTFMGIGFFGALCFLWICCCPLGILFICIGICVAYS